MLCVYKPAGPRSREVVDAVEALFGCKAGHAGALDGPAEGLLVVCVGKATRLSEEVMGLEKGYEACLVLGLSTDTGDLSGVPVEREEPRGVSLEDLRAVALSMVGEVWQRPHPYSSVKVDGVRAHEMRRRGLEVELTPRLVEISYLRVLSLEPPDEADEALRGCLVARIRVFCSRGTYVRSLAEDLGRKLGIPSCVGWLKRFSVGSFGEEDAVPYEALRADPLRVREALMDPFDFLSRDYPSYVCDELTFRRLSNGSSVPLSSLRAVGRGRVPWWRGFVVGVLGRRGPLVVALPQRGSGGFQARPLKVMV